jgi:hypothetical protein
MGNVSLFFLLFFFLPLVSISKAPADLARNKSKVIVRPFYRIRKQEIEFNSIIK